MWAYAITLWQIFSCGGIPGLIDISSPLQDCPQNIVTLIQKKGYFHLNHRIAIQIILMEMSIAHLKYITANENR